MVTALLDAKSHLIILAAFPRLRRSPDAAAERGRARPVRFFEHACHPFHWVAEILETGFPEHDCQR
jgi:hypothetical protein